MGTILEKQDKLKEAEKIFLTVIEKDFDQKFILGTSCTKGN